MDRPNEILMEHLMKLHASHNRKVFYNNLKKIVNQIIDIVCQICN
jgi:hypothetical protein